MRIAVGDIGGTNARFALAEVAGGKVVSLDDPVVLPAKEHADISSAWQAFGETIEGDLPRHAVLAIAAPLTGGPVIFTNLRWTVDPATLADDLALDEVLLLNDFGAMAHAVDALGPEWFEHLCGPDAPLPGNRTISVVGAGTGLGVAILQRTDRGSSVLETEGGHIHFAPLDPQERRVCDALVAQFGRASIERVVAGPGLGHIVRTFDPGDTRDDAALWADAVAGREPQALDLYLAVYGSAVGDLSLAHGSMGVVLTGGLTNRMKHLLGESRFHARFCDKARYVERMQDIPVKLVTHPQPGLFGAAAAFAKDHAP